MAGAGHGPVAAHSTRALRTIVCTAEVAPATWRSAVGRSAVGSLPVGGGQSAVGGLTVGGGAVGGGRRQSANTVGAAPVGPPRAALARTAAYFLPDFLAGRSVTLTSVVWLDPAVS